jgi:hypothetical protein
MRQGRRVGSPRRSTPIHRLADTQRERADLVNERGQRTPSILVVKQPAEVLGAAMS